MNLLKKKLINYIITSIHGIDVHIDDELNQ